MLIFKITGAILITLMINLLLRNKSPETALLLNIALAVCVCICSGKMLECVLGSLKEANVLSESSYLYLKPLLKCLGVSLITKIGGEVCRDASNGTASAALEFAGLVCALSFTMPIITLTVKTVCELL